MADRTAIEWTDSTWNPTRGCTKVSPGCKLCYAERFAERFRGIPGHPFEQGFDLRLVPEAISLPLRWRKPRRVFVDSMSDLFHPDVPEAFIFSAFAVMAQTAQHTFQILTKRPERAREFITRHVGTGPVLRNIWIGTSVENQAAADERIPHLLATPARVRFLSCEPLLGPVVLPMPKIMVGFPRHITAEGRAIGAPLELHWVIAGGESGPGARPMHPAWARALRDQCAAAGVPFFFKQWGVWRPKRQGPEVDWTAAPPKAWGVVATDGAFCPSTTPFNGHDDDSPTAEAIVYRVGKKRAGRLLDGRTWDEMPGGRGP